MLVSTLFVNPLEAPGLGMEPFLSPASSSAIEACLVNPSMSAIKFRFPPILHADRLLEIDLAAGSPRFSVHPATSSLARTISANAQISVIVQKEERSRSFYSVPVSVRTTAAGWTARALIRPQTWDDAASVTLTSITLTGRPLPCDCLPVTLRVGYNHASAPAGAVHAAANAGDVLGLQAALDAGGSTEEADEVCGNGTALGDAGDRLPHIPCSTFSLL